MEVYYFNQVAKFIGTLDDTARSLVYKHISLLSKYHGNISDVGSKKVLENVFELKIIGNYSIRVFFAYNKGKIWLIYAYIKKSQKIEKRVLKHLKKLSQELA